METCFISYSHDGTSNEVNKVLDKLKLHYEVLIDKEQIDKGDILPDKIRTMIRDSDIVFSFINKDYINSKNCVDEFNYAIDYQKRIIPIIIVGDFSSYPAAISSLNGIQISFNEGTFENDLKQIKNTAIGTQEARLKLEQPGGMKSRQIALYYIINIAIFIKDYLQKPRSVDDKVIRAYRMLMMLADIVRDTDRPGDKGPGTLTTHVQHIFYNNEEHNIDVIQSQADIIIERAKQILGAYSIDPNADPTDR